MTEAFLLSAVCASSPGPVQAEADVLDWTAKIVCETARRGGVQLPRIGLQLWSGTGEAMRLSTQQIQQCSGYLGPVVSVLAGRASSQHGITWGMQAVESNQQANSCHGTSRNDGPPKITPDQEYHQKTDSYRTKKNGRSKIAIENLCFFQTNHDA